MLFALFWEIVLKELKTLFEVGQVRKVVSVDLVLLVPKYGMHCIGGWRFDLEFQWSYS